MSKAPTTPSKKRKAEADLPPREPDKGFESYHRNTVPQLKVICKERNLKVTGRKQELIQRLVDYNQGLNVTKRQPPKAKLSNITSIPGMDADLVTALHAPTILQKAKEYVKNLYKMTDANWHDGYTEQGEYLAEYGEEIVFLTVLRILQLLQKAPRTAESFPNCVTLAYEALVAVSDSWEEMKSIPSRCGIIDTFGPYSNQECSFLLEWGLKATVRNSIKLGTPTLIPEMHNLIFDYAFGIQERPFGEPVFDICDGVLSNPEECLPVLWKYLAFRAAEVDSKIIPDAQINQILADAVGFHAKVTGPLYYSAKEDEKQSLYETAPPRLAALIQSGDYQKCTSIAKRYEMKGVIDRRFFGPKHQRTRARGPATGCLLM